MPKPSPSESTCSLCVLYYNARSLLPKLDDLRAACLVHSPDIICITETWLDETISNHELCLQNFDIVRRDRNRQGGGTLIYINNSYSHSHVFSGPDDLELIVLTINNSVFNTALGLFYRPPNSSSSIFDTLLTVLLMYPYYLISYLLVNLMLIFLIFHIHCYQNYRLFLQVFV